MWRTIADNFDVVTELTSLSFDLDTIVQKLLKISTVEDAVRSRL